MSVVRQVGIAGDGFTVQANMMLQPTVWPAMAEAYRSTHGELVERLLSALDAAEAEGGDIRGRQSAAIRNDDGTFRGKRPKQATLRNLLARWAKWYGSSAWGWISAASPSRSP